MSAHNWELSAVACNAARDEMETGIWLLQGGTVGARKQQGYEKMERALKTKNKDEGEEPDGKKMK